MPNLTELFSKFPQDGHEILILDTSGPNIPKIQRVPHPLRDQKKFGEYYSPRFVSFGPIHYGEPHLQLGEEYKHKWAPMFLQDKSARDLYQKIQVNIKNLRDLYTEDAIREFDDDILSGILFVDGCSVLQILQKFDFSKPENLKLKVAQMALVRQDVMLLENQLPFTLLKLLIGFNGAITAVVRFTKYFHLMPLHQPSHLFPLPNIDYVHPLNPPHLLHQLRDFLLQESSPDLNLNTAVMTLTYRNIKELKEAGIRVKRSQSTGPLNISFESAWFGGRLKLPKIEVDHSTAPTYMNMIAYEMCPDFENYYGISSYVQFLDSLIDHPDDVKELRAAGILYNGLGSDEEVANLFNMISTDVVPTLTYAPIRVKIETHYQTKYKTWLAQAYYTYFNSPWSIIAFLAALLALFLTAAQTWVTVFPRN